MEISQSHPSLPPSNPTSTPAFQHHLQNRLPVIISDDFSSLDFLNSQPNSNVEEEDEVEEKENEDDDEEEEEGKESSSTTSSSSITSTSSSLPTVTAAPSQAPSSIDVSDSTDSTTARPSISKKRSSIFSVNSVTSNRSGLFTLVALARDKTNNAIASFTEPSIRSRPSSGSLYRSASTSINGGATSSYHSSRSSHSTHIEATQFNRFEPSRQSTVDSLNTASGSRTPEPTSLTSSRQSLLETYPPSQAYESTDANTPAPTVILPKGRSNTNSMHQTSSRLLRMTDDERPFTKDFKDLFATLMVSLPLTTHRVRLTRVEHSFVSEEAINNLGSLKFSQSNRMPDPKDPSRIVTTTTTTTFSMAREMARSVCQRFLEARFIESADGKQLKEFTLKGNVWQLTPKGIHVLQRFCSRNGIQQKHVTELLASPKNTMQLVIMERDFQTDKLSSDRGTIEVIFRRFIGANGPNIKTTISSADSDSLSEYKDGIAGVKMANERKVGAPLRTVYQTFTGKAATDWLMDCSTIMDRREAWEIAVTFVEQELIWCVQSDRAHIQAFPADAKFQPTKHSIYQMTQKGKDIVNMTSRERSTDGNDTGSISAPRAGVSRDSNTQKLDKILTDAALRLLFRENLRDTHCEENLSFYLDVDEFLKSCKLAIKTSSTKSGRGGTTSLDSIKETMASAYGIYNAFLAPGSPCELNIDHLLRNQLATRMTKAVGQDAAMIESLKEVTRLFEEAQISVFKLMASDSVPKFMKSAKYEQTLKNYDFDTITNKS